MHFTVSQYLEKSHMNVRDVYLRETQLTTTFVFVTKKVLHRKQNVDILFIDKRKECSYNSMC